MTLATKEPETMQLHADTIWELTLPLSDFRAVAYGAADKYENRPMLRCVHIEQDPETGGPVLVSANGFVLFHLTLDLGANTRFTGELPEGGAAIPETLFPTKGAKGDLHISQFESGVVKATYPDGNMRQAEHPAGSFPNWRSLIPDPETSYESSSIGLGLYTMIPLVNAVKMLDCGGIFKLHQHKLNGPLTVTIAGRPDFGGVIMPAYTG